MILIAAFRHYFSMPARDDAGLDYCFDELFYILGRFFAEAARWRKSRRRMTRNERRGYFAGRFAGSSHRHAVTHNSLYCFSPPQRRDIRISPSLRCRFII